jgi:hypothetical protein
MILLAGPVFFPFVTGSGTGFSYAECDTSAGDPITGALVHVPSRDLLICAFADGGVIRLQYMNVASGVSQPTLGGEATLGTSLSVGPEWGAMCWCSDSERLLVFGVSGNTDKVYEIEIPATLSNSWPVTSHTLAGGATIVPKSKSVWGKSVDYNPATRWIRSAASSSRSSSATFTSSAGRMRSFSWFDRSRR